MKKIKDEVMTAAMLDFESGMRVPEVCKKRGISETAFYRWKSKYSGLKPKEILQVRESVKEETRLKRKVKEQERVIKALQAALKKKF